MVKGIDDLRVVDLKDELKSRGVQFESKMRKAHLKQLLETTMSESGLDSSLYDFEANKTISETPQKAATPTKRNDTPAVMTPRRSRRLSGQSSDGEASDAESKPVRRKLLKNLESVQEEPEETLPETMTSTPSVRRSRRLSNQSVENDQEQEAQKLPSLPEAIVEEDEETEEKEKPNETISSNASSPIIKVNLKPSAIIIDSDQEPDVTEEEGEEPDASEETCGTESPVETVEKKTTEENKIDTDDQQLEEESQKKETEAEEKQDLKNTEATQGTVIEAQESDEKNDAVESEGEDAANIGHSCTKSDNDEISVPEDEGIHISEELNPAIFEALEKSENTRKRKIKWASKKRPAKKKLTAFPDDRGIHAMPSRFVDKIDSRCQSAVEFRNKMMGRHDQARMSKEKSLIQMIEKGQSKKMFKNSLKEKNRKIFQREKFESFKKERKEKKIQSSAKIAAKN